MILTGEMKEIMNQVLIAEKKAQANTIMRREETASTRSLLNTAKLMEENEVLWKLKEMEYMEKIADKIGDITVSGNNNIVSQLKEILQDKLIPVFIDSGFANAKPESFCHEVFQPFFVRKNSQFRFFLTFKDRDEFQLISVGIIKVNRQCRHPGKTIGFSDPFSGSCRGLNLYF